MLAGRHPQLRKTWLEQGGGSRSTEDAIARALAWLAKHQSADGHWSLHAYHQTGDCKKRCGQPGLTCDTGGTALAMLPFLGNAETHQAGPHAAALDKALKWLIARQDQFGTWPESMATQMYAHAMSTIVLCEAFTLSDDQTLRAPAQKAVNFILSIQDLETAGWRYHSDDEGDTSVTGWQLMALRVARDAGLEVPENAFTDAMSFLDSVQEAPDRARYAYLRGFPVTPSMTAQGMLAREYAGWQRDNPALQFGINYLLLKENLPDRKRFDLYYWYASAQVMRHWGGKVWEQWNPKLRDVLLDTQEKSGHLTGSWKPIANYDLAGGRLYMTALAACTLQIYYRYRPVYPIYPGGTDSMNQPQRGRAAQAAPPAEANQAALERAKKKPVMIQRPPVAD